MNDTTPTPTPTPLPDDRPSPQPDEQPTAVLGEQPGSSQDRGAQQGASQAPGSYPPPASQQPPGAAGTGQPQGSYPPPSSYGPAGTYQQTGPQPPSGGYQQTTGYQQAGGYQQPGAYQQPGPSSQTSGYQQPAGYPPPRPAGPARRLTRSRSQRMIGGVCGGLARYWNTDPLLLRILAVVLTLATGGALLIGYLIAWIAIPDEPMRPVGAYGQSPDQVGYAAGGNPSYSDADPGAPYVEPAPRERSHLGWLTLSVAVLVAGVLGLIGLFVPASVGFWGVILGVTLAILGLGILVGARYGRARWLLWLAIPLTFVTFGTVAATNYAADNPNWARWTEAADAGQWGGLTVGERSWPVTPADVSDSPLEYRLSAGSAVLDLTGLTALDGAESARMGQRVEIDAGVGVGELIIVIPRDVQLDLSGTVELGEIDVPGSDPTNGRGLAVDTTVEHTTEGQPAYLVTIDAAVGIGSLEVRREAA